MFLLHMNSNVSWEGFNRCLNRRLPRASILLTEALRRFANLTLPGVQHLLKLDIVESCQSQVDSANTRGIASKLGASCSCVLEITIRLVPTWARWELRDSMDGVRSVTATQVPSFLCIHEVLLHVGSHLHFVF